VSQPVYILVSKINLVSVLVLVLTSIINISLHMLRITSASMFIMLSQSLQYHSNSSPSFIFRKTHVSRFLVRRFLRPAVSQAQTEKTRSTYARDAGAANRSSVNGASSTAAVMMTNISARKTAHLRFIVLTHNYKSSTTPQLHSTAARR